MPQKKKPVTKPSPKAKPAAGSAKPFAQNFRMQALVIFLFAFALYANTLGHQYALDDDLMIRDNKFTKQGFSGIGKILTTDALAGVFGEQNLLQGGRYRPLSQICFAIEYELFGLNPFIGHLINVLLYGLLCVVLFHVLRKIFADFKTEKWYFGLPFLVTVLFAVHPLHTEAVANIKGRDEIMSLLGSLGSLWFALKYCENKKPLNLLWAALIFILALLSKENALTFIAVIPLTMYFFSHAKGKDYLLVSTVLIAGFALYALIRYNALGFFMNSYEETELFNNPFAEATVSQKYATIVFTWFRYIGLIVFGNPLTHDYYPYQVSLHEWSDFPVILSLVIYAFLAVVAIIKLKRKSLISFAILFFAVTFSIQSNLLLNIGTFMNERFMFVALIGFCVVVAVFFRRLSGDDQSGKKVWPQLALYLFLFLIVTFSSLTINRNRAWKNSETLFLTDVKTSVNSARCNYLAGFTLLEKARKELDAAKKNELYNQSALYLERGLKIYGKNTSALGNLGEVYIALGRNDEARAMYMRVLELIPDDQVSIANLRVIANLYVREKSFNEAIQLLKMLADKSVIDPADYNAIGEIFGRNLNQLDSAELYFQKSLERYSEYAPALENMGLIHGMRGNYQKSLEYLLLAYPLDSTNVDLLRNLSSTYTNLGNTQKAVEMKLKAEGISAP
ncbi:MAG: hypothetical protein A2W93_00240 [Bacteroidetes bacterium GWF2_43_63]|nr:MAG: hypothetical protein A2W94_13280 [Bacteroidetes bacterium GWE2_42_42]OFY53835.1 MAG: hypothetical protein A2W93_00240 [Bacteroidetes bacterium GWF2_43_63]HBG69791.1 hypothetical protein [Bacteroidales bacterium]HCB61011.1 hypothetical protein [Bacteroidales bacterium]HCY24567.1 hypothetical protein [Bacteroidales bacterium]